MSDFQEKTAERLSAEIAEMLSTEYGQLVRQDIPYVAAKIREAMQAQEAESEKRVGEAERQRDEARALAERRGEVLRRVAPALRSLLMRNGGRWAAINVPRTDGTFDRFTREDLVSALDAVLPTEDDRGAA